MNPQYMITYFNGRSQREKYFNQDELDRALAFLHSSNDIQAKLWEIVAVKDK